VGNYTATIDWGDGTVPSAGTIGLTGTISATGPTFSVTGSHTYAAPGKFTVKVTVTDKGGSSGSSSTGATVGNVNERFVAAVFQDLLHRPVDASGLTFWASQLALGVSAPQVVQGIENSVEYRTDVVEALYTQYLHRAADSNGLATFVALLGNGGTDAQVAAAILGSQEYFQLHGNTNAGFLTALYQDTLNRAPDAMGLAAFTQELTGGTSPSQVAAEILSSSEYQQVLVQSLYEAHLHRAADSGGLAAFSASLQGGASVEAVIAALLGSPEFLQSV
jgi:PKD repeat protein